MKKITKRDVLFFVLGFITMFVIDTISNWENVKKEFKEGWDAAGKKEQSK